MYMNQALVIGRMTHDPELRSLPNGTEVTKFSVATNRTWKDNQGEKQEEVEFHNVVCFWKRAETIAQYFHKGDEILVQGHLKTSSWDDNDTGKKMYRTEIILDKFEFGQKRKGTSEETRETGETGETGDIDPEDIPF